MRLNNLRTWLMGTAAVLTFFVANETADAATTTTSTTASETTRTSSSSIAAKRVALRQTTSSVEESSANAQASSAAQSASGDVSMAKTTSSEPATSSASSTTAGHATSVADATKTVSADTTAKSQGTTATDQITSQSSSVRAKNEQAQTQNKQQMTRMYSGVITSQKGSSAAAITVNKAAVLPAKMLLNLSRASLVKESTSVEGLNAADTTVTDDQGVTYNATDELSLYANYNATYHWTIADGVKVAAGSTATVTLPDNVAFTTGTRIDLKKADGTVVGTVTAEAGSHTGTLTFNDYFANNDSQNRQGDLTFYVTGTSATVGHNTSSINKVGWADSDSLDAGIPTKMFWQVVANINSAKWQQVKIVDQLGLYQTHEGTMTLETGYYTDGAFVKDAALGTYDFATQQFTYAEGVSDPQVTVKVEGQQMTITIDHLETAVNLFYEVGLTAGHTYANNASVTYTTPGTGSADPDPGDGSSTDEPKTEQSNTAVKFGGSGTASDEVKSYSLLVTKTDDAGQPVAGATYQLETGGGVILRTDLVTDESGQLRIGNLSAGSYVLVETKAPNGYQLDSTRHEFDVSSATTNIVTDSVVDHRISQTALTVNKVWAGVPTGVQTPSVEVTLQRNGQDYRTLQLTAANGYTGTFDQLDVTDVNGQPYTYTVVETALAGYTSSQTTSGQTVTITNTYQTGQLTVVKTDASGKNYLAGAVFTIENATGEIVAKLTTDATGRAQLTGLAQGTYKVTEVQAPVGYLINPQAQTVTLDATTHYQGQIVFADENEPSEPSEPSEPNEPSEPSEPNEPSEPSDSKVKVPTPAVPTQADKVNDLTGGATVEIGNGQPTAAQTGKSAVELNKHANSTGAKSTQLPQTSEQPANWPAILGWLILGLTVVVYRRRAD